MTVYIVTSGAYEDFEIERVCSTRGAAEALRQQINYKDCFGRDCTSIQEWVIDGECLD